MLLSPRANDLQYHRYSTGTVQYSTLFSTVHFFFFLSRPWRIAEDVIASHLFLQTTAVLPTSAATSIHPSSSSTSQLIHGAPLRRWRRFGWTASTGVTTCEQALQRWTGGQPWCNRIIGSARHHVLTPPPPVAFLTHSNARRSDLARVVVQHTLEH